MRVDNPKLISNSIKKIVSNLNENQFHLSVYKFKRLVRRAKINGAKRKLVICKLFKRIHKIIKVMGVNY